MIMIDKFIAGLILGFILGIAFIIFLSICSHGNRKGK